MKFARLWLFALCVLGLSPVPSSAQLTGQINFIVLRVQFNDMTGTTYTVAESQKWFTDFIPTLWGNNSAYGLMQQNIQVSDVINLANTTAHYINGDISSASQFSDLYKDAVSNAPAGLNWQNVRGLIVLFSDTRSGGFYRGITYPGQSVSAPGGTITIPVSIVGENPAEDETSAWGRVAHEIGHEMQQGGPAHPSDYNSNFDQMDGEYPAQTGVFEKQATAGFPGWLPPAKYVEISPSVNKEGTENAIWAEENNPTGEPDAQAIKAHLSFGGSSVYYLISVRRRTLGDDLAAFSSLVAPTDCNAVSTPNGIPDCGVLIERVVEGGDPNFADGDPAFGTTNRWVHVLGNPKGSDQSLWHLNDVYSSATYGDTTVKDDGITIGVRQHPDKDHYVVYVSYTGGIANQPDIGMQSWLQPPGNTYETTDIWMDSPVNGYASPDNNALNYRYGVWADGLGGVVPIGNGDDPAVGQDNRFYARVRNYGTKPATNVTVYFDVTDPPGLGIQGSNGFKNIGSVGPAQFANLASIPAGGSVDVYFDWTPNVALTQAQIAAGQFAFHTCVRVRLSHVPGETFFANQDGDGEQENVSYFDATGAGGTPGAPGPANSAAIHLKNDSPAVSKTFILGLLRDTLPAGWILQINGGNNVVTVPPAGTVDVPVSIKQNVAEPVGTRHVIRVIASDQVTFTDQHRAAPFNKHDEAHTLGGVQFQVAVLRKTHITCHVTNGIVQGQIQGLDPRDVRNDKARPMGFVTVLRRQGTRFTFVRNAHTQAYARADGTFSMRVPKHGIGACLYAGSQYSTSAGSQLFQM